MKQRRAVFLDRDGVLNEERDGDVDTKEKLHLFLGVESAIKLLNDAGFLVFIVTNQPIIARGNVTEKQVKEINKYLVRLLEKKGGKITRVYFCPHHPHANVEKYRVNCDCRKPAPGMLLQAAREYSIDLKKSFVIGDRPSDITLGKNVGSSTIMIISPHNEDIIETGKPFQIVKPDYRFATLLEATKFIIKTIQR